MPGSFSSRPFVLHEANLTQVRTLKPNLAILPWGATEGHNYHLPHGTDVVEATVIAETAAQRANERGARCIVLPCIPFGNDNQQLTQTATITMRSATQQAVLFDVADSLVRQKIDRLVLFNFHGGNEFKPMIRDIMLALPIFIVQAHGFAIAPHALEILDHPKSDHADEFETSLMMHLKPQWVAPLSTAGDGATTPSKLPAVSNTPGVWAPRNWAALTRDTGAGDPRTSNADKGARLFEMIVEALVPVVGQLSAAQNGEFPFII